MNKAPEYAYHLLRGALEHFHKNISELNQKQYKKAKIVADKTFALESIVLSTPEARDIIVSESRLNKAIEEVIDRYTDHESFLQDLKNNGLDDEILRKALYRELLFDIVMGQITANIPKVSDIDVHAFYQLHKERFTKPEKRTARHILITINPEFSENDRMSAFIRIHGLSKKLQMNSARFGTLAKRYSECPTALEGGKLGELVRGTLYPELDTELFRMQGGEVSQVIESEMGFHILLCEKINKSITIPLSRARPRITQVLQDRQRKACQKTWLDNIQQQSDG
jgi:peptidyl-prolyl cis-trans isomerase C